jgi:hypothetical protein
MYDNDQIGDCTTAAVGHLVQSWTANAVQPITPSNDDIIGAYAAISGYNPATGENDVGANELDVLSYWRTQGIAGHKIVAYVSLDLGNQTQIKQAINLFGGIYVGANMPVDAQDQTSSIGVWSPTMGTGSAPGSWGGHAFPIGAYDPTMLCCITWGARQLMTWSWFAQYVDEAYALVSTDMLELSGFTPLGINIATLMSDLAAIGEITG